MNEYFNGRPNAEISDTLPPGVVKYGESWVESRPLSVPDHASTCFIRGRFDSVLEFEDGSYAVIDFKTTSTQSGHLPLYTRQLHAYAYALERAAPGNLALSPITRPGSRLRGNPTRLLGTHKAGYPIAAMWSGKRCPVTTPHSTPFSAK